MASVARISSFIILPLSFSDGGPAVGFNWLGVVVPCLCAFVLVLMARLAHGDEPLNRLSAYVAAGIPFVVNLRGTCAAKEASITIAL